MLLPQQKFSDVFARASQSTIFVALFHPVKLFAEVFFGQFTVLSTNFLNLKWDKLYQRHSELLQRCIYLRAEDEA